MKVGFDLTPIIYHRGVSRYTSNLFCALNHIPNCELFAYASSGRGETQLKTDLNEIASQLSPAQKTTFTRNLVLQHLPPTVGELFWHYLGLNPIKKLMPTIEVFHSWDYLQPPDVDLPLVSTIHDLAILKYPEVADPTILRHHQKSWAILKKRHAHIIAVSQATKNDIINLLHFPEDHVHLIYEALPQENLLDKKTLDNQDISVIRRKFSLTTPYFFFIGTREPRKNLERLIQAWWPLRDKVALVLAGASGWQEPKYQHPQLKVLPPINNQDLGLLYHFAQAVVYPSLDEGFGLPILEAFYYQTPVVTSEKIATAEVAGRAAILVNPHQTDSIAQGLAQALTLSPSALQTLRQKMTAQLNLFSWQKTAQQTAQVYQQAIEEFNHA